MLCGTMPFCLDRRAYGFGEWVALPAAHTAAWDVEIWPCSVGILVKWVASLGSLHWGANLGVGGVSLVEMLILYEMRAGERLVSEKAVPTVSETGTPNFSVGCFVWSRH